MALDIAFLVIAVIAAGYVATAIRRKIPLLLQVPEQLIEESFITRPPYLTRYLEPAAAFLRAGRWRHWCTVVLIRALQRVRLWLLRTERAVFRLIESLQGRSERRASPGHRPWASLAWSELKQWKQEARENGSALPGSVLNPEPPPETNGKQHRLRRKTPT